MAETRRTIQPGGGRLQKPSPEGPAPDRAGSSGVSPGASSWCGGASRCGKLKAAREREHRGSGGAFCASSLPPFFNQENRVLRFRRQASGGFPAASLLLASADAGSLVLVL
jgi:hypothetical protein